MFMLCRISGSIYFLSEYEPMLKPLFGDDAPVWNNNSPEG